MKPLFLLPKLALRAGLIILALLAGPTIYYLLGNYPGFVMIAVGTTSITINLWFAAFLLLGALALLWLIVRLLRTGSGGFSRLMHGTERRNRQLTARGLVNFMEGNWKASRRQLLRAASRAETPLINYLAAARCAFEMGDEKETSQLLHKAEQVAPKSSLAIALTQARMHLSNSQYEQAAATLQRAQKQAPKHPVVLDLLHQVYEALNDWDSLDKLLPQLRRHHVLPSRELQHLTETLYWQRVYQAGDKAARADSPAEGLKILQRCWSQLDSQQQSQPNILQTYIEQLQRLGQEHESERVLRRVLSNNWNSEAVLLYGRITGEDPQKQLLRAEGWLTERPANAELLLTLGRLSLRNELWGKARDYFESSLKLQPKGETYAELARLLANLGEHVKSTEYYQKGLLMMTAALPALPQPHRSSSENAA